MPQGQSLERGGLARVVGPDENNRLAQFDFGFAEPFEIANS
jgi:hypothetical protein